MLRLLQTTPTDLLAQRLTELTRDTLAGELTLAAIESLRREGAYPGGLIASLAGTGVGNLADPDTVRGSVAILVEELLAALD